MSPLTERATACYASAALPFIEAGDRWYPDAHQIARDQATKHGTTIEVASGVIAALSPRMSWKQNVRLADRMLASGGTLDFGCLGRSLGHARAIYVGAAPLDVLSGPKTRAFYQAVLTAGQSPDPVIDTHAWDMLVGQRGTHAPNPRQYRLGAECMIEAAQILDKNVHHVQAVTWLTWRARFRKPGVHDHVPELVLEGSESW